MFLLALLVPAATQLLSGDTRISGAEKRALEPMPVWPKSWSDWVSFPKRADRFLQDHFGLRPRLLVGWKLLQYEFRYSADPFVAIGQDGWLYYSQYWKEKFHTSGCDTSLPDLRVFADHMDRLTAYAAMRHVPVLFAIAPDKEAIYPEYLPEGMNAGGGCDLFVELMPMLERERNVRAPDLRAMFKARKAGEQVYFRTDSHWNDVGSWHVSRVLLDGVCAGAGTCAKLPTPSFSTKTFSGDLLGLIGLGSVFDEKYVSVDVPALKYGREVIDDHPWGGSFNTERLVKEAKAGRTLQVIGDSFGKELLPVLIADESVSTVIWSYHRDGLVDWPRIVAAKPSAILIVMVERSLYNRHLLQSFASNVPE